MTKLAHHINPSDWAGVDVRSLVDVRGSDECWPWLGSIDAKGYGRIRRAGRDWKAHRIVLALSGVALPPEMVVDHLCRNVRCVNPRHLQATTNRINTARGVSATAAAIRARLDGVCINGHVIADVGLHKQGSGHTCAACGRDRVARYKRRRVAA